MQFIVELKDSEMARVQTAFSRNSLPATLAELAEECVTFLTDKTMSVEKSAAIADAISKLLPIDKTK